MGHPMMAKIEKILEEHKRQLLKAFFRLKSSYNKIQKLPTDPEKLNDEQLEIWESFSSRFGRASEMFVSKYLRTVILKDDPSFEGTLRDLLNRAEKLNLIEDADQWLDIRAIRNVVAHDYSETDLEPHFLKLKELTPIILSVEKNLLK